MGFIVMVAASMIAQTVEPTVTLQTGGVIVMGLSFAIVCGLTLFCIVRLLSQKDPGEHHHVPLDIDTRDTEQPRW